jgi:hypothetical protein
MAPAWLLQSHSQPEGTNDNAEIKKKSFHTVLGIADLLKTEKIFFRSLPR